MYLRGILPFIVLVFVCATASAETLGDVLDKGAKKISGQEAANVFKTGVLQGKVPQGSDIEIFYKPDGTFAGTVAGAPFTDSKWYISGDRLCVDWWLPQYNRSGEKDCNYWFRLNDDFYFVKESDTDRNQEVNKRRFSAK